MTNLILAFIIGYIVCLLVDKIKTFVARRLFLKNIDQLKDLIDKIDDKKSNKKVKK